MSLLERVRRRAGRSATAPGRPEPTSELLARIDEGTRENRAAPDPSKEREILALRHRAALRLIDEAGERPAYAEPAAAGLEAPGGVPELVATDLDAERLRAAILRYGCLLVRGLVGAEDVERIKSGIDRAFEAREEPQGDPLDDAYWTPFEADPRYDLSDRAWIGGRSNFWGPDSPRVMVDLFDTFERSGFRTVAADYLGERPAISVNKCTLRRVYPDDFEEHGPSNWHQDGAFMGDVRALNVWLSLTRSGDVSPGLDIVPRRLEEIVETGTEGSAHTWSVSQAKAREAAGDAGIVRPIFEPGDVLLFDEMCLHATAATPDMPNVRYAVECWFFGTSAFPADYAPILA